MHADPIPTPQVLRLTAPLSLDVVAAVKQELLAAAAAGVRELDLSAVAVCYLAGIQLLLAASARTDAGHAVFRLRNPSPAITAACTAFGCELAATTDKP
jgi:anti-anti-sigma regulatory factor